PEIRRQREYHRMIGGDAHGSALARDFLIDLFKSRRRLEAENLCLRHQLSIAPRRAPPRLRLSGCDRAMFLWLTPLWPSLLGVAQVVEPETMLRWHRAGFRAFWRWKSRRPMSRETPTWGAPRIHGELLMLEARAVSDIDTVAVDSLKALDTEWPIRE